MIDFDNYRELLMGDRSYRRFDQSRGIERETLENLVGLTRFCASGRNLQPLRYRIVNTPEECAGVFSLLAWAGYLPEWPGPQEGERPTAYLIQCLDTRLTRDCMCDDGLHLQAITLGARTLGLGGCILKAFPAAKMAETLGLPDYMVPQYVLALGYPVEHVVIEAMKTEDDYRYYRTPDAVHHVPKRPLDELIIR